MLTPLVLTLEVAAQPNYFGLTQEDWYTRGFAAKCVAMGSGKMVFVEMWGTRDHDVSVFDCADPDAPVHLGRVKSLGNDLDRFGDLLVSQSSTRGVLFWDVTDPLQPKIKHQIPGLRWGDLAISRDSLFRLNGAYLERYSLADLDHISLVSVLPLPRSYSICEPIGEMIALVYQHTGQYDIAFAQATAGGLEFRGQHQIRAPGLLRVGSIEFAAGARDGQFALISNAFDEALHVFDLRAPDAIRFVGSVLEPDRSGFVGLRPISTNRMAGFFQTGIRTYEVGAEGNVAPLSPFVEKAGFWQIRSAGGEGTRLFGLGVYVDLAVVDCAAPALPVIQGIADALPDLRASAVDGDFAYLSVLRVADGGFRTELLASKYDPQKAEFGAWSRLDVPAPHLDFIRAEDGWVAYADFQNFYLLRRREDGRHELACQGALQGSLPQTSSMVGHLAFPYFALGNSYYDCSDLAHPVFLGMLPDTVRALFSKYAACTDASGLVSIHDLSDAGGLVRKFPGAIGDVNAIKDRLFVKKAASLVILRAVEGAAPILSEYDGFPEGDWNISADDSLLLVWANTTAHIYGYGASDAPHLLGVASIPPHECHGGWYGTVTRGRLFTADEFLGLNVMRIDGGNRITSIDRVGSGSVAITFEAPPSRRQQLEASSDLRNWSAVGQPVRGRGGAEKVLDESPLGPRQFYRVVDIGQ